MSTRPIESRPIESRPIGSRSVDSQHVEPQSSPEGGVVEAFAMQTVERVAAAWSVVAMHFGDRLGLYCALVEGAGTADEIATRAGVHPRLTREWLDGQVAFGIVELDGERYRLPAAHAAVLGATDSPAYLGAAGGVLVAAVQGEERIIDAFRTDGAVGWGDQAPCLSHAVDRFYRPGYATSLVGDWIGALDGVAERLAAGGRVADIGCGRGTALQLIAEAFPSAICVGVDDHEASIARAAETIAAAGLAGNVRLERNTATTFAGGPYDLICFLDALHDMGDPQVVLRHVRSQLAEGGSVMLVEPAAKETLAERVGDLAAQLYYPGSALLCTPSALSQGDLALGNQVPEATWRDLFRQAGFTTFRRVADTPFNRVFEAR
jgi:2-polyprenyl-3-methyl-5-hydroxy-6-metoxy-1,4-benzoquinol methylase